MAYFSWNEFIGVGIERRFDGVKHLVLHRPIAPWLIKLFISFGFGITVLMFEADYVAKFYLRAYRVSTSQDSCQQNLNRILAASINTKSLQIRLSRPYDLAGIRELKKLQNLYLGVKPSKKLDLSENQELARFWVKGAGFRQVTGLSQLPKLMEVSVDKPSEMFLSQLPRTISCLEISGGFPKTISQEEFPRLTELSISWSKDIDFSSLPKFPLISRLTLRKIGHIENVHDLITNFPGLDEVVIFSTNMAIRKAIMDALPSTCSVINDITKHAELELRNL